LKTLGGPEPGHGRRRDHPAGQGAGGCDFPAHPCPGPPSL